MHALRFSCPLPEQSVCTIAVSYWMEINLETTGARLCHCEIMCHVVKQVYDRHYWLPTSLRMHQLLLAFNLLRQP